MEEDTCPGLQVWWGPGEDGSPNSIPPHLHPICQGLGIPPRAPGQLDVSLLRALHREKEVGTGVVLETDAPDGSPGPEGGPGQLPPTPPPAPHIGQPGSSQDASTNKQRFQHGLTPEAGTGPKTQSPQGCSRTLPK